MTDATDATDAIAREVKRWVPSRWCELCLDHELLRKCRQIAENMRRGGERSCRDLLIIGPRSSGKHALANVIARHATCVIPTRFGACGRCQNCRATPFTLADERPPWKLLYAHLHGQDLDKESVERFRARIRDLKAHQLILVEGIDRTTEEIQRWMADQWVGIDRRIRWLLTAENEGRVVPRIRSIVGPHLQMQPPDLDLFCSFVEERFRERGIFIRPSFSVKLAREHLGDFKMILSILEAEAGQPQP
jgi:hypothetical protein